MDEYGFSIMSAWRNHNKKLPYDSGGATKVGSFVRGGHETSEQVHDSPPICTYTI